MTSVSAGHIILTPTQPVGSGQSQRESNPGPPDQDAHDKRSIPVENTCKELHCRIEVWMKTAWVSKSVCPLSTIAKKKELVLPNLHKIGRTAAESAWFVAMMFSFKATWMAYKNYVEFPL